MIHDLKPYPAYKDSGVPWLGEVPEHWEVRTFRTLASAQKGRTPARLRGPEERAEGDLPYLSMEYLRSDNLEAQTFAAAQRDLVVAQTSDLILLWDGSNAGEFFLAKTGVVSSTSSIIKSHSVNPKYFFYACKLAEPTIRALTVGMGIPHVDGDVLKGISFSLPSANEQSAIVRYLDYIDRRIRRYIHTKQKLIKLLEEQKKTIIHQAVTRGLDPNVKLKSSGVEWLGDIPEHWEVKRLKTLVKAVTSGSRGWSDYASDYGPMFIRIGNLTRNSIELDFSDVIRLNLPRSVEGEAIRTKVETDDLLLSITAFIGSVAVVPSDIGEAYVSQHVARCALKPGGANPRWIAYVLLSPIGQSHGQLSMYGGTKQGLSLDDVKNYLVVLPPRTEQDLLVQRIEAETQKVIFIIDRTHREISLLREYRTRLIADVVTGKLDVRETAVNLPEETEPTELTDIVELEYPEGTSIHEEMGEANIQEEAYL